MSSQKQCKRVRRIVESDIAKAKHWRGVAESMGRKLRWHERRPPWWKFWAMRKWKQGEPV